MNKSNDTILGKKENLVQPSSTKRVISMQRLFNSHKLPVKNTNIMKLKIKKKQEQANSNVIQLTIPLPKVGGNKASPQIINKR